MRIRQINRLYQMQRLLPKVINQKIIKSALVEAVLRRNNNDLEMNDSAYSLLDSGHYF